MQSIKTVKTANTSYLSGYGKITEVVVKFMEDATALGDIESIINGSVEGLDKDAVYRLDKAYQTASKRKLGHAFGIKWDAELEQGVFHIPAKRKGKKDELMVKVAQYRSSGARTKEADAMIMRLIDTIMTESAQ